MSLNILPAIALRGLVVFPKMTVNFDIGRDKSLNALKEAKKSRTDIILISQKDMADADPDAEDLLTIGTLCHVKQHAKISDKINRVMVEGVRRVIIKDYVTTDDFFTVEYEELQSNIDIESPEIQALMRAAKEEFDGVAKISKKFPGDINIKVQSETDPDALSDIISAHGLFSSEDKHKSMEIINVPKRLESVASLLNKEIEILKIETQINNRVRKQLDKMQRDHYLHEQIKAIKTELGETDAEKIPEQKEMAENLPIDDSYKEKILKEIDRLATLPNMTPESGVLRTWLGWIFDMPWHEESEDSLDIDKAQKVLDQDHYGLEKVKERIIEYLAVRALTNSMKGPILCFVGPPGVGKTSIAKSIARATNREFIRMSLGGVRDEAEIRGHRRTYIGAMPGRIISNLKQAGTNNPVYLLDEIEKMSSDFRGDPASAMLEVLDSEQNSTFTDHYLEVPFDLSKIMFLATANSIDSIPPALFDRMEIIHISGYTDDEKLNIAKKYLIPKQLENHGITEKQVSVDDAAILAIISSYTKEAGVRELERQFASIARKSAKLIVGKKKKSIKITPKNLEEFLGVKKYLENDTNKVDQVGVATGLAWTSVGGVTLNIEVNIMPGTGKLQLTGQLGDVMKESASAGLSYIRANSKKLGIADDNKFYEDKDIHIHIPAGATPKDGPSAGITMATSMLSALTNTPVRANLAMTGEITLRGNVLPIGGLKEKSLAAYRAGIKKILVPADNVKDIAEIPEKVKKSLEIVPVKTIDEVLKHALVK